MKDDNHGGTAVPQFPQTFKEGLRSRGGEQRRRFIENQEPRLTGKGPDDFQRLNSFNGQISDLVQRTGRHPGHPYRVLPFPAEPLPAENITDPPSGSEKFQGFGNGEPGRQGEALMNDVDTGIPGGIDSSELDVPSIESHRSGVRTNQPRDGAGEGGFSRSVLPRNRMDSAGIEAERNAR